MLVWSAWVGPLPLPGYLRTTWRTVVESVEFGAQARLVRDADVQQLLSGDLHPTYSSLSYVHRADYVRMALLHKYGGLWVDLETVALRNFTDKLRDCVDDGLTVPRFQGLIGPLRPNTPMTQAWRAAVHEKLDSLKTNLYQRPGGECNGNVCSYALGWTAILGNIWRDLEQGSPSNGLRVASQTSSCLAVCSYGCAVACSLPEVERCAESDVAMGLNAGVAQAIKQLSEEQFLHVPGALGQLVRSVLRLPTHHHVQRAIDTRTHCVNHTAAHSRTPGCPPKDHPHSNNSNHWSLLSEHVVSL